MAFMAVAKLLIFDVTYYSCINLIKNYQKIFSIVVSLPA